MAYDGGQKCLLKISRTDERLDKRNFKFFFILAVAQYDAVIKNETSIYLQKGSTNPNWVKNL